MDSQDESQQIYQEIKAHMDALYASKDYVTMEEEDAAFAKILKSVAQKYGYTEKEIGQIYVRVGTENAAKFREQNKDL